jgi:hypothetical protein
MKTLRLLSSLALTGVALTLAFTPSPAFAQGMPPALRENIHALFNGHDAVRRTVTLTDDGYVSVTESDNPKLVSALREHVSQMEARMRDGGMVRRWDPAFPEFVRHYPDMIVRTEETKAGIRVTVRGKTPAAVKVAQNHAKVVSDFAAKGWEAHDRSHPAVLTAGASSPAKVETSTPPAASGKAVVAGPATCRAGECCGSQGKKSQGSPARRSAAQTPRGGYRPSGPVGDR